MYNSTLAEDIYTDPLLIPIDIIPTSTEQSKEEMSGGRKEFHLPNCDVQSVQSVQSEYENEKEKEISILNAKKKRDSKVYANKKAKVRVKVKMEGRGETKRRPKIPKDCRQRIFQLWSEYQRQHPLKPLKKDAGAYIATIINQEFP